MSFLRIKLRIVGKKNQGFVRFIVVPIKRRQRGMYLAKLGYWDIRQNKGLRVLVFNISRVMFLYSYGAIPNKTTFRFIFYFFFDLKHLKNWVYFSDVNLRLLIEHEIKNTYK